MPVSMDAVAIFEAESYIQARPARLRNLFAHVDPKTLAGKRVFEAGCGTGAMGEEFAKLGCRVVSVDASEQFIATLRKRFPGREAHVMDLERQDPSQLGAFDIVLCFGILYHLSRPTAFLAACARMAPEIYLETMVCDSEEAVYQVVPEEGPDQAISGFGCRPSLPWISMVMGHYGFDVRDISSGAANWGGGAPSVFDWTPLNDSAWMRDGAFLRKMLLCARKKDR